MPRFDISPAVRRLVSVDRLRAVTAAAADGMSPCVWCGRDVDFASEREIRVVVVPFLGGGLVVLVGHSRCGQSCVFTEPQAKGVLDALSELTWVFGVDPSLRPRAFILLEPAWQLDGLPIPGGRPRSMWLQRCLQFGMQRMPWPAPGWRARPLTGWSLQLGPEAVRLIDPDGEDFLREPLRFLPAGWLPACRAEGSALLISGDRLGVRRLPAGEPEAFQYLMRAAAELERLVAGEVTVSAKGRRWWRR
ncbi:MAG: hypothetical protein ACYDEA_10195 [Candidatus Dormibacteria bacterium]